MMIRRESADPSGKWLGLIVFIVGIVLLLFVFYRGFVEFSQVGLLPQSSPGPTQRDWDPLLVAVARWALLFLLAFIASAVAGRGIALYQAARPAYAEEA